MVEGKLFKTKLCVLHQEGRCTRHSCTFAHGNSELRGGGHPPQFEGARDGRGRLDKWHSPPRQGWEGRVQRPYMGHTPSTSLERSSQRKRKFDHKEEFSRNARFSRQSDDRARDRSFRAPSSKSNVVDELKQVQADVTKLNARKAQLQHFLEERDKEFNALTYRVKELEAQLYEEREESHKVASKIKKFVKAYNRHSRIQDELNMSQARLHKLGMQLGSHIASSSAQGDGWTTNALSEDEGGNQILNSGNGRDDLVLLSKRGVSIDLNTVPGANSDASLLNEERYEVDAARSVTTFQQSRQSSLAQRKNGDVIAKNGYSADASSAVDRKRDMAPSSTIHFSEHRSSDAGHVLPATGMAAHADDEGVDLTGTERGPLGNIHRSDSNVSNMQPPPPSKGNSSKNKISEDALDEETVDVDIV